METAVIKTEGANFVKPITCVILKTYGHDCTQSLTHNNMFSPIHQVEFNHPIREHFTHFYTWMLLIR